MSDIVDAPTVRTVAITEPAKGWSRDFALAPKTRPILLKDLRTGQVVAARHTNFPSPPWLVFDPGSGLLPPGDDWNARWHHYIDGWDHRHGDFAWMEFPQ